MSAQAQKTPFKRVWQYAKPYKLVLTIATIGAILDAIVNGSFMMLFEYMIDDAFGNHNQKVIR
ncbi:MAG TPA: hypothetical protein ENJ44_08000, partial [Oceanospirillales bacterium]|nr:hypothetical protein [Oceanospirillales bacterium]